MVNINIIRKIPSVIKGIFKYTTAPKTVKGVPLQSNVVPFSPVGGGAGILPKAGSVIKNIYKWTKTTAAKKTIDPTAGVTGIGNKAKFLTAKTLGGATLGSLIGASAIISEAGVTGKIPSDAIKRVVKGGITGLGIGLNPIGGIYGLIRGGGLKTFKRTKEEISGLFGQTANIDNALKSAKDILPTMPTYNIYNQLPDQFSASDVMPTTPQTILIEGTTPSINTPSFSPSVSLGGIGGGLSENLPLLLLLGGLGGGYLLGRRRKKKKRYKKKKMYK